MNKLKRTTALLLCALMVLAATACGGAEGGGSSSPGGAKGRYVEKDITPPDADGDNLTSFLNADGTLVCYGQGLATRYESTDGGENWTRSDGPGATNPDLERAWNFTLLPDGSLLAAVMNEEMTGLEALVKISPDGTTEPFSIPELDEDLNSGGVYVSVLKALSADRLFLSYSSGGMAYIGGDDDADPEEGEEPTGDESAPPEEPGGDEPTDESADPGQTGEQEEGEGEGRSFVNAGSMDYFAGLIDLGTGNVVAKYNEWTGTDALPAGDTFYLMDYTGEVLAKNLSDGSSKSGADMKVSLGEFVFNLAYTIGADGTLYALDGKKIQKVTAEGGAETVLDGGSYSFSGAGGMMSGLNVLADGSFLVNLQRNGGSKLYKYTWDPDAEVDPAKVLKVWSLNEDARLRAAINTLRSQNPDVLVEYEVALGEDSGMTAEDAVKNLNTRMLNGDGPDVLVLDGIPVESYAGKGLLMDLSGKVDTSGLFDAVKAPFETENGTFCLPAGFRVPLLLGTAGNLADAGTLEALAKKVQDGNGLREITNDEDLFANIPENERPVLAPQDLPEMFELLWNSSAGAIVTDEGLDSAAAESFLSALKTISDKYGLGEEFGGAASGAMAVMGSDGSAATVKGSVLAYNSERALLGGYLADDIQMLNYMLGPPNSEYVSFPGLESGSWIPVSLVGVNADTEKTELALNLVSTLLGDDVQGNRSGSGFPVTAGGMDSQIAYLNDILTENTGEGFEFNYAPLVSLLDAPDLSDDILTDMVWPVAESLCKGDTDLEGAVKQLEQDLKNYLAERQ